MDATIFIGACLGASWLIGRRLSGWCISEPDSPKLWVHVDFHYNRCDDFHSISDYYSSVISEASPAQPVVVQGATYIENVFIADAGKPEPVSATPDIISAVFVSVEAPSSRHTMDERAQSSLPSRERFTDDLAVGDVAAAAVELNHQRPPGNAQGNVRIAGKSRRAAARAAQAALVSRLATPVVRNHGCSSLGESWIPQTRGIGRTYAPPAATTGVRSTATSHNMLQRSRAHQQALEFSLASTVTVASTSHLLAYGGSTTSFARSVAPLHDAPTIEITPSGSGSSHASSSTRPPIAPSRRLSVSSPAFAFVSLSPLTTFTLNDEAAAPLGEPDSTLLQQGDYTTRVVSLPIFDGGYVTTHHLRMCIPAPILAAVSDASVSPLPATAAELRSGRAPDAAGRGGPNITVPATSGCNGCGIGGCSLSGSEAPIRRHDSLYSAAPQSRHYLHLCSVGGSLVPSSDVPPPPRSPRRPAAVPPRERNCAAIDAPRRRLPPGKLPLSRATAQQQPSMRSLLRLLRGRLPISASSIEVKRSPGARL